METRDLNRQLRFTFSSLDLKGENLDEFFERQYGRFVLFNSELKPEDKIWAMLTGQLDKQTEIEIHKDLRRETFIQSELVKIDEWLKMDIDPELREKLNIWSAYLNERAEEMENLIKNVESSYLYFYREPENNENCENPFILYQPTKGTDFWGVNLFDSQHTNKYCFFKRLNELPQEQIPDFLQFHLDKYEGEKSEWVNYVHNIIANYIRDTENKIKSNLITKPNIRTGYKWDFLLNKSPKYQTIMKWLSEQGRQKKEPKKLTQPELALLLWYKKEPITESNKEEKAIKYKDILDPKGKKGSKLAENYGDFNSLIYRIPSEYKKQEEQLKRYDKIIPHLSGKDLQDAENDNNVLKEKYFNTPK